MSVVQATEHHLEWRLFHQHAVVGQCRPLFFDASTSDHCRLRVRGRVVDRHQDGPLRQQLRSVWVHVTGTRGIHHSPRPRHYTRHFPRRTSEENTQQRAGNACCRPDASSTHFTARHQLATNGIDVNAVTRTSVSKTLL